MRVPAVAALVAVFSLMVLPGNSERDVKYYFFSKEVGGKGKGSYQQLSSDLNVDEFMRAGFNKSLETKILIHGFNSDVHSDFVRVLTKAYQQKSRHNLLAVDWGNLVSVPNYVASRWLTRLVAKSVASLINFLVRDGLVAEATLHVIGHSLGSHIAGVAGREQKFLRRITGLDPASPLIDLQDVNITLSPGDAKLVDVIHTSSTLGTERAIGDIDFYANGGRRQPGCSIFNVVGSCSHDRSYKLFAESILDATAFPAHRCQRQKDAISGKCEKNETAIAGEFIRFNKLGPHYFKTRRKSPYSLRKKSGL